MAAPSSLLVPSPVTTQKRVALIVDDALYNHVRYFVPELKQRGQQASLAITSDYVNTPGSYTGVHPGFMTKGDIRTAYRSGIVELVAHSDTHPDMTTLISTTRQPEWDNPKTLIESVIGAGNCKNWVYPQSHSSLATDQEAWGRYDHVLTGAVGGAADYVNYRYSQGALDTFSYKYGRWAWQDSNHAATLALIASLQPGESMILYTHGVNGQVLSNSVTLAELRELLDLCVRLGIQMVKVQDLLPPIPVDDVDFADNTFPYHSAVGALSSATRDQATGETIVGFTGSTALHINRTITTSGTAQLRQDRHVPVKFGAGAYKLSARVRLANKTGGTGGASLMIIGLGDDGQSTGNSVESSLITANAGYAQINATWTPTVTSGIVDTAAELRFRMRDADGDAYFRHVAFGLSSEGVLA